MKMITSPGNAANGQVGSGLIALLVATSLLSMGCGESFLEPEPKSFLAPENVLTSEEGLEGLLVNQNKMLRWEYYGGHMPILTEYYFTDIAVCAGASRESVWPHNMVTQVVPTGGSWVANGVCKFFAVRNRPERGLC